VLAAVAVILGAGWLRVQRYAPDFPERFAIVVQLDPGAHGAEPLIATGRTGSGDLLYLRHYPDGAVSFEYDSWGRSSVPIGEKCTVPANGVLNVVVEMPSLYAPTGHYGIGDPALRVWCDGKKVLDGNVGYYAHPRRAVWFGENSIGSGSAGSHFSGTIRDRDGNVLRGATSNFLPFRIRFFTWLKRCPWEILSQLVFGVAVFWLWQRLARSARAVGTAITPLWPVGVAGLLCAACFLAVLTQLTWDLTPLDFLARFYDFQASAMLAGRIDVPLEGIGGEAFECAGKYFGYFGVTPAILRLPLMMFDPYPGDLAVVCMIAEYLLAIGGAVWVLREAAHVVGTSRPSAAQYAFFVAAVGLGSPVFFLATRPMFYHEAILSGFAFALATCAAGLRLLWRPTWRTGAVAVVFCVLAVNGRQTTGLYAALFVCGCVLVSHRRALEKAVLVVATGAALLSANAVAYWRFGTLDASPLSFAVSYRGGRLDAIGQSKFHLENIPFGASTYLLQPNLRLTWSIPFIHVGIGLQGFGSTIARLDVADRTVALPFSTPCLFFLACGGVVAARRRNVRVPVAIAVAASLPVYIALFAFMATAQRYSVDLFPPLVVTAAFALMSIDALDTKVRGAAIALAALLLVASVIVSVGIAIDYQTRWGPNFDANARAAYRHRLGMAP